TRRSSDRFEAAHRRQPRIVEAGAQHHARGPDLAPWAGDGEAAIVRDDALDRGVRPVVDAAPRRRLAQRAEQLERVGMAVERAVEPADDILAEPRQTARRLV